MNLMSAPGMSGSVVPHGAQRVPLLPPRDHVDGASEALVGVRTAIAFFLAIPKRSWLNYSSATVMNLARYRKGLPGIRALALCSQVRRLTTRSLCWLRSVQCMLLHIEANGR
jgi:hypothetical protein